MPAVSPNRARLQASLACMGTAFLWWRIGGIVPAAVAALAAGLALLAWLSPASYAPVQRFLDRLLHFLLTGLTWFVLALLYLGIFSPMRLWRAVTKQDSLQRRFDSAVTTYLRPLPPANPGRFDRQF